MLANRCVERKHWLWEEHGRAAGGVCQSGEAHLERLRAAHSHDHIGGSDLEEKRGRKRSGGGIKDSARNRIGNPLIYCQPTPLLFIHSLEQRVQETNTSQAHSPTFGLAIHLAIASLHSCEPAECVYALPWPCSSTCEIAAERAGGGEQKTVGSPMASEMSFWVGSEEEKPNNRSIYRSTHG